MTYKHRMSVLNMTGLCAQSGRLSQVGAARAAAQSTCFHAVCARDPRANDLMMRLTEDELAEIMTWRKPADVDLGEGIVLHYADAEKEFAVGLDKWGSYVEPDSEDAVTVGHPDFAWIVTIGGKKYAYVADIKRSEWTVSEGVNSLQVHAYALAVATKHDCDGYAVGLWAAVEGTWQWSSLVEIPGDEALKWARRIVAAATNTSDEYSMGPHCRNCYGRLRCPAWLVEPSAAKAELAPLAQGETALSNDTALPMLLMWQRVMDTAGVAEKLLKAYAVRNGGITDPATGKVWRPSVCQGRESAPVAGVRLLLEEAEKLGASHIEVAAVAKLIKKGSPYEQFRWTNGAAK